MLACIKYVVIIYNFVFWLLGVALLSTTIFLYVDSQNYVNFEDTSELHNTPFLLFMSLGALMTLVGFMGCCGAIRESTCVLGHYFLFCITMCVACGAAIWWSVDNSEIIRDRLQRDILKVVKEKYGRRPSGVTETVVDKIQQDFQCCGVRGPSDWSTTFYNSPNKNSTVLDYGVVGGTTVASTVTYRLPASCCVRGAFDCERLRFEAPLNLKWTIDGINGSGCWNRLDRYIEEQWKWLLSVACLVIGVQLLAVVLACCLCCAISRGDDK